MGKVMHRSGHRMIEIESIEPTGSPRIDSILVRWVDGETVEYLRKGDHLYVWMYSPAEQRDTWVQCFSINGVAITCGSDLRRWAAGARGRRVIARWEPTEEQLAEDEWFSITRYY